jgi:hypothetical protein
MFNIIIGSEDVQANLSKKIIPVGYEEEKNSSYVTKKESHSFNFCSNLRKYEKKKAEDYLSKKEVNFIEKNIKGVSEDFMNFDEN